MTEFESAKFKDALRTIDEMLAVLKRDGRFIDTSKLMDIKRELKQSFGRSESASEVVEKVARIALGQ